MANSKLLSWLLVVCCICLVVAILLVGLDMLSYREPGGVGRSPATAQGERTTEQMPEQGGQPAAEPGETPVAPQQ